MADDVRGMDLGRHARSRRCEIATVADPHRVDEVFDRRKADFRIPSAPVLDEERTSNIDGLDSYRLPKRERLPEQSDAAYARERRRDLVNALRIYDELTRRYGVPAELLSATGYGQDYPMFPQGTEQQRQQDRRVLVVRTK